MGVSKPQRPLARPGLVPSSVGSPDVARAFDEHSAAIQGLEARQAARVVIIVSLAIGLNKIAHTLGRAVTGYTITPTVADAAFAHALVRTGNTQPSRFVWINVVGAAQPGATLEVF